MSGFEVAIAHAAFPANEILRISDKRKASVFLISVCARKPNPTAVDTPPAWNYDECVRMYLK